MPFRVAYKIPGVSSRVAKDSPAFRRLKRQATDGINGTWTCCDCDGGALAVWPGTAVDFNLSGFKPGRETEDGLTFYGSLEQPEMMDLLKSEIARPTDGDWLTLSTGAELWIATAALSETRYVLFANGSTRPAEMRHAYGIIARDLYEQCTRSKDQEAVDPALMSATTIKLVVAAIHASYDITDEMIQDMPELQLSATDIQMIRGVAWGLTPKECAAALIASRLSTPAAESLASPSPLQNPQP